MIPADRPYPDELISSALARCCRWFDVSFRRLCLHVLDIPPKHDVLFLTVPPLLPVARLFETTAEDLLWNHTQFPYATAFVSQEGYENALNDALSGGRFYLTSVMRAATGRVSSRRFCPQCVAHDRWRWGEAYWHRAHHLPGVFVCHKHGCPLHLWVPSASTARTFAYASPGECVGIPAPRPTASPGLLQLAKQSEELLRRPFGPGTPQSKTTCDALATKLGWLTSGRNLNREEAARLVLKNFSPEFFAACGMPLKLPLLWSDGPFPGDFGGVSPMRYLMTQIALTREKPQSAGMLDYKRGQPLAKIDPLLADRAEIALADALASGRTLTQGQFLASLKAHELYYMQGTELPQFTKVVRKFASSTAAARPPVNVVDLRLAKAAEAELAKLLGSGVQLTTRQFLGRFGAVSSYKHRKHLLPKLCKVVKKFERSDCAVGN